MDKRIIIYMIFLGLSFFLIQTFFSPKTPPKYMEEKTVLAEEKIPEKDYEAPSYDENFYVLENEYQQLVFSDIGGSLVEINLLLHSKDPQSIIRPIEFDKIIERDFPQNAQFPQKPFYTHGFIKHSKTTLGGYYPLLRRSIYDKNNDLVFYVNPKHYCLNILSTKDEDALSNMKYKVTRFEKNLIEFEGADNKRTIVKTFYFSETKNSPYLFNVKIKVDGDIKNLWLSSGIPEVELTSNAFLPALKYRTIKGSKTVTDNLSLPKALNTTKGVYVDWISNSNGFFGIIVDPTDENKTGYKTEYIRGINAPTRLTMIDSQYNLYPASKYPGYQTFLPLPTNKEINFRIFSGPFQDHVLKILDEQYSKPLTGYNPDYLSVKSVKGWLSFATEPFAKFLLLIMRLFYNITRSWGFSIILLTLVFRIMLYPLNSWSIKSTMRMQEITPLLKVIDAKYKKDPQKANLEKMKLFKEKGANPVSGCLPILIQLPFLFGMFNLLKNTFDLRGVSFIPGWIDNLTSPDVLFSWKYPIFFIGTEFHLLPIALGIVMFIQSKMNMKKPKDKSKLTDQEKQQMIMMWAMPILFTVLFYKAASGLNIYFFFSMLLGILQQWYMSKHQKREKALKLVK